MAPFWSPDNRHLGFFLKDHIAAERDKNGFANPCAGGPLAENLRLLRSAPYAKRVAVIVLLSTVTLTLADFVFKRAIDKHVAPEQMGTVFATIYFALNLGSLVIQVGVVVSPAPLKARTVIMP